MNQKMMRKYARLAVCTGINVQKGQLLVINCSVRDHEFARLCAEEAYKAGAGEVVIEWNYEEITKLSYENCSLETLCEVPQYVYDKRKYQQDKGAAFLSIASGTPGLLSHIDPVKLRESQLASMKKMADLRSYTMANHGQWCIVALPNKGWAKKVFPELDEQEAFEKLENAILSSVRISEDNDPVEEWQQHISTLKKHIEILDGYHFDALHFTSELGTDLTVGLVRKHLWAGGDCKTTGGVDFVPNMPTEEVFCMPDKYNVNGRVYASKPLSYQGKVVEDFWFEFKDGKVVDYGAKKEVEAIRALVEADEGSCRLGEVALISYDSPISRSSILFYNTLFDENASCHLALGASYPENIEGGMEMSDEQLEENHGNTSMEHCDFMFGTPHMKVTGITADGREITVFEDGNFAF